MNLATLSFPNFQEENYSTIESFLDISYHSNLQLMVEATVDQTDTKLVQYLDARGIFYKITYRK